MTDRSWSITDREEQFQMLRREVRASLDLTASAGDEELWQGIGGGSSVIRTWKI